MPFQSRLSNSLQHLVRFAPLIQMSINPNSRLCWHYTHNAYTVPAYMCAYRFAGLSQMHPGIQNILSVNLETSMCTKCKTLPRSQPNVWHAASWCHRNVPHWEVRAECGAPQACLAAVRCTMPDLSPRSAMSACICRYACAYASFPFFLLSPTPLLDQRAVLL